MTAPTWREVAVAGHTGDEATARAALAADDPDTRQLGLGALERMGALTADDLHRAAVDPAPSMRRRAATVAAGWTEFDLTALLDDPETMVAEAAAWAAGEHAEPRPAVMDRLCHMAVEADDPLVREAAVAALGAIGDEHGLPAILRACGDKPAVRRRAVLALAPFEGPEVDAALETARHDRDWQVRQAVEDIAPTTAMTTAPTTAPPADLA